ncbi:hypothetical protein RDV89_19990 [Nocardioides zeae]|uniref:PH domain-containing protein n=1 Tax=Nocardioides imazamoxiresistens TaxID=3231893 RepID=A0ABU3Q1I6_9ACTN|nr:hypothetical protein [Nocardioides zeae]MDT9595376.1 hypothetical protein [Nocardioides zeae]
MSSRQGDGGTPTDLLGRWLDNRTTTNDSDPSHRDDAAPEARPAPTATDSGLRAPEPEATAPAPAPERPGPTGQHAVAHSVFAALRADDPEPTPEPEPEPEPETEPETDLDTEPDPEPSDAPASPLLAAAQRIEEERQAEEERRTTVVGDGRRAELEVLAALGATPVADEPAGPAVDDPDTDVLVDDDPAAEDVSAAEVDGPGPAPAPVRTQTPTSTAPVELRVEFGTSRVGQVTTTMLILLGLGLTVGLGYLAYRSRDTADLAFAGVAAAVTLVVWAVRASSPPTRVVIDRGTLVISRGQSQSRFDLTNLQLDVEENGTPGRRDWSFVVHRRSLGPVAVDRSMVEPERFMETVRRYRRDV